MALFMVDTIGEAGLLEKDELDDSFEPLTTQYGPEDSEDDDDESSKQIERLVEAVEIADNDEDDDEDFDYGGLPPPSVDIFEILRNPVLCSEPLWSDSDSQTKARKPSDLENFCKAMGWLWVEGGLPKKKSRTQQRAYNKNIAFDFEPIHDGHGKTNVRNEMKRCVLKGIEQKECVEKITDKKAAKLRKLEKDKTRGKDWFNMPATEITDELRQDMEIIQMRSVLNPTHFYKKNDLKTLPKYFQVGTVLPSALDRRPDAGVRPSKKRSLVDELLADAEFQQFNKRKYNEVMAEKSKTGYKKAYKKAKKEKKRS